MLMFGWALLCVVSLVVGSMPPKHWARVRFPDHAFFVAWQVHRCFFSPSFLMKCCGCLRRKGCEECLEAGSCQIQAFGGKAVRILRRRREAFQVQGVGATCYA